MSSPLVETALFSFHGRIAEIAHYVVIFFGPLQKPPARHLMQNSSRPNVLCKEAFHAVIPHFMDTSHQTRSLESLRRP